MCFKKIKNNSLKVREIVTSQGLQEISLAAQRYMAPHFVIELSNEPKMITSLLKISLTSQKV